MQSHSFSDLSGIVQGLAFLHVRVPTSLTVFRQGARRLSTVGWLRQQAQILDGSGSTPALGSLVKLAKVPTLTNGVTRALKRSLAILSLTLGTLIAA